MKNLILAVSAPVLFMSVLLLSSADIFSQWQQTASIPDGAGVTDMVVLNNGTIIVTTASYNWPSGQQGGIRRSTDGGASWQNIVDVYNGRTLWLGSTGKIFASYWPYPNFEGAYYSTNGGLNWTLLLTLSGTNNIFSIASKNNDSTIFLGTRDGVRRSTNNGNSFINLSSGFPSGAWIYDLDISSSGSHIAAGTTKGAYVSSNNGNTWVPVAGVPQTDTIFSVKFISDLRDAQDESLNMGSGNGNFYATGDPEFIAAQIFYTFFGRFSDITVVNDLIFDFMGLLISGFNQDNTNDPGFVYSTNQGASWIQENSGLTNPQKVSVLSHQVTGNTLTLYAGLFENNNSGAKIFKYGYPIGIQQLSNGVPEGFSLSQNYPNPFNPVTNIEFSVPEPAFVKLVIYDMLGREVETIISKNLKAGTYKADWDASGYTSGVYFYRLSAGEFTHTKKMILVK